MPDKQTTTRRNVTKASTTTKKAPQSEVVRDPAADAVQGKPDVPASDYRTGHTPGS